MEWARGNQREAVIKMVHYSELQLCVYMTVRGRPNVKGEEMVLHQMFPVWNE